MFITFEGGEGSGKTSVIKAISQVLTENNIAHITTREQGGSVIAEKIRKILLEILVVLMYREWLYLKMENQLKMNIVNLK